MPSSSSNNNTQKQRTQQSSNSGNTASRKKRSPRPNNLTPAMMTALNSLVKTQILRQAETKRAYYTQTNNVGSYLYTLWSANQIKVLTPNATGPIIVQGVGQGDRVGNRISIVRAQFRYTAWVAPYNSVTNPTPTPMIIRFWFFTLKENRSTPTGLNNFFQAGDSSVAPIGNIIDLNYEINSDAYTLFKKVDIKLGYAAFVATPGGLGNFGYYSNNDSEMSAVGVVDLTPFYPKIIEWSDDITTPYSRQLIVAWEAVLQDGTTLPAAQFAAQMNYQIDLSYKDF